MNVFLWYKITPSGLGNKQVKSLETRPKLYHHTHTSFSSGRQLLDRSPPHRERETERGQRQNERLHTAAQNLLWIKLAQPRVPLHPLLFRDACPANSPSKLSHPFLSLSFLHFCLSQQHEPSVVLKVEGFSSGRLASAGNMFRNVWEFAEEWVYGFI